MMLGALSTVLSMLASRSSTAQSVAVPADLQAKLLSRVVSYDRNFAARAGKSARVLLVVNKGDGASVSTAAAMRLALSRVDDLGGVPHSEAIMNFETGAALAKRVKSEHAAIVYLTPGLTKHLNDIRDSLKGVDVLTVAALPEYVPNGAVLGFEVASGKPKMSVNLAQAKSQNVNFKADVLKLMKVYR